MANNTTGRVWEIDTAAEIITNGMVKVIRMEWHPAAANNDLTIKDYAGTTIWDVDALAEAPAGVEVWDSGPVSFRGFNVSVIDGGTLYVTIG